jgi:hypothetical protein
MSNGNENSDEKNKGNGKDKGNGGKKPRDRSAVADARATQVPDRPDPPGYRRQTGR